MSIFKKRLTKEEYIKRELKKRPYLCSKCLSRQYDLDPGYAVFCDKHKPTFYPGMPQKEYEEKYGITFEEIRKEAHIKEV